MPLFSLTPDLNTKLRDAATETATGNWQIGGQDLVWDLDAAAFTPFDVHVDLIALKTSAGDEKHRLLIQGSTDSAFASGIANLAELTLGDAAALDGDTDPPLGSYVIRCHNDVGGTIYRYLRGTSVVSGTSPSAEYGEIWAGPAPL